MNNFQLDKNKIMKTIILADDNLVKISHEN